MTYLRIGRVLLRRRRASRTVDALAAGGRLRQTGAAEAPSSPRLGPGLANGHMALIQGPVACVCLALAHREGSCGLAETPRRRDAPQQRRRGANSKDGFVRPETRPSEGSGLSAETQLAVSQRLHGLDLVVSAPRTVPYGLDPDWRGRQSPTWDETRVEK